MNITKRRPIRHFHSSNQNRIKTPHILMGHKALILKIGLKCIDGMSLLKTFQHVGRCYVCVWHTYIAYRSMGHINWREGLLVEHLYVQEIGVKPLFQHKIETINIVMDV